MDGYAYDTGLIAEGWRGGPPLTDEDRSLAVVAALAGRSERPASGLAQPGAGATESAWQRLARREAVGRRLE